MNRKKRRRKSKSAAMYIPAGVLLILVLLVLGTGVFLRVINIEVTGAAKYSHEEIILASGITKGDNMLFRESDSAARRIRMAMPDISEVEIQTVLPDTVRITVRESKAVAAIAQPNGALLIDSTGRVLSKAETIKNELIEIRGFIPAEAEVGSRLRAASGSETQLISMTDVLAAFGRGDILDSVSYLDVTHIATISFGYIGRFTVILGGSGDADHKLSQLPGIVGMIDEERTKSATGVINMSDPSGEWRFNPDW